MELTEATEIINKLKDKELSRGCEWINHYTNDFTETVISPMSGGSFYSLYFTETHFAHISQADEIIGHPFTYGDAFYWIEKSQAQEKIVEKMQRGKTHTPLLEQLRIIYKDKRKDIDNPVNEEAKLWFAKLVKETLITK